jgi:hypothetical protein
LSNAGLWGQQTSSAVQFPVELVIFLPQTTGQPKRPLQKKTFAVQMQTADKRRSDKFYGKKHYFISVVII